MEWEASSMPPLWSLINPRRKTYHRCLKFIAFVFSAPAVLQSASLFYLVFSMDARTRLEPELTTARPSTRLVDHQRWVDESTVLICPAPDFMFSSTRFPLLCACAVTTQLEKVKLKQTGTDGRYSRTERILNEQHEFIFSVLAHFLRLICVNMYLLHLSFRWEIIIGPTMKRSLNLG